jgi:hypothetical protein
MHAARWLFALSASFSAVAAVAAGCGGGTNGAAPLDSGSTQDVTTEVGPTMEAAVEAAPVMEAGTPEAAPMCVPDAMISTLPVPDASFGDSGATAATCLACFETSCPAIVTACNMDCACISAYETFSSCLAGGGGITSCIGTFATAVPGVSITQFACAFGCATPTTCGFSIPTMGGDSGTTSDGATSDGPTE